MSKISTTGEYQGGLGAIDLILNDSAWNEGVLDLKFGYAMLDREGQPSIAQGYIDGILLQELNLTLSTRMMDELAKTMTTEGSQFNPEYGSIMEKALGDRSEEDFKLKAGSTLLIFGIYANFLKTDAGLGTLSNPAFFCIPETRRDLMSLPYPGELIHIPWLAVRGSNRDIVDITGKQLVDRFVMEKMRDAGQRRIIVP